MAKKYTSSPIIEAVCEFRFSSDTKIDILDLGKVYEKLKEFYPKVTERKVQDFGVHADKEGGLEHIVKVANKVVFLSDDEKRVVQLDRLSLSVSCYAPYPTWEVYGTEIQRTLKAITSVAKIKGFERIGLRYINKIEINAQIPKVNEYFNIGIAVSGSMPSHFDSFILGAIFSFNDSRDKCKLQLANTLPEKEQNSAFVLDLDYWLEKWNTFNIENTTAWVEEAHKQIETLFESSITDKIRALLSEEKK